MGVLWRYIYRVGYENIENCRSVENGKQDIWSWIGINRKVSCVGLAQFILFLLFVAYNMPNNRHNTCWSLILLTIDKINVSFSQQTASGCSFWLCYKINHILNIMLLCYSLRFRFNAVNIKIIESSKLTIKKFRISTIWKTCYWSFLHSFY